MHNNTSTFGKILRPLRIRIVGQVSVSSRWRAGYRCALKMCRSWLQSSCSKWRFTLRTSSLGSKGGWASFQTQSTLAPQNLHCSFQISLGQSRREVHGTGWKYLHQKVNHFRLNRDRRLPFRSKAVRCGWSPAIITQSQTWASKRAAHTWSSVHHRQSRRSSQHIEPNCQIDGTRRKAESKELQLQLILIFSPCRCLRRHWQARVRWCCSR